MDAIDEAMHQAGALAYVAYGTSSDATIRYLTSFRTSDPVIYLKRYNEKGIIVVPAMEITRAAVESPCTVMSRADAGFFEVLKKEPDISKATARVIADLAGGDIIVPSDFPFGLAKDISSFGNITIEKNALSSLRAIKTEREIGMMQKTQAAAEDALTAALAMIRRSRPSGDHLVTPEGSPLTSEQVRYAIHAKLLEHGCRGVDTIVASGDETSEVHLRGSGPIAADAPIILDIFPQDEETGYFADMTRTVVRGEPSPEIREMYESVSDAQALAFSLIRAGADGSSIYQAVVSFFSDCGYGTEPHGFVHSLGHGVGLDIHEAPSLNLRGSPLAAGNVITIEPGLYYPGIGGVRIEDMGLVTGGGFSRITRFPEVFCL
ncbi:Xaa-Pro peptidase family protein [Methanocalculus sp.]|uniref:M24 family metallopeptidase n=1 Tax=Methanocalculus sp. TaxID=2004547 RepID=UPI002716C7B7|nr:Xaa-Pro peptidase family protein [Methanocalculus sp.]MDO8842403.1 Xaa-Pro peptidase family protein [Methanocalculus sp.]